MGKRIKQLIFIGLLGCAAYFALAYHFIFFGREVEFLKKEKLVLDHTFYSPGDRKEIMYKGLDSIIANEDLRQAGIGELLEVGVDQLAAAQARHVAQPRMLFAIEHVGLRRTLVGRGQQHVLH